MSVFKELDPEVIRKALEGYSDILTPEAARLESLYKSKKCPRCLSGLQKEFDPRHVFADQDVSVPRALLRCAICRYCVDPHSNLIIEYGDASKIPVESAIHIIDPKKG
jgi:hypothetical protein